MAKQNVMANNSFFLIAWFCLGLYNDIGYICKDIHFYDSLPHPKGWKLDVYIYFPPIWVVKIKRKG